MAKDLESDAENPHKGLIEWARKRQECGKRGHPNATKLTESLDRMGHRVYMVCPDCGEMYDRGPTQKESEEMYTMLHTPMTI
tara:strand:- start:17745 stop:17990 length:246 start_codon:yes stop_codon:yes gene_type:complete